MNLNCISLNTTAKVRLKTAESKQSPLFLSTSLRLPHQSATNQKNTPYSCRKINFCVSNHLTGCAVDIRCIGVEQALRYANILLDIADGTKRDFDELFIERNAKRHYWIHFAVRPKDNRRKVAILRG